MTIRTLSLVFVLICTGVAFGQTASLTGTVRDASTGQLLPGATIRITGTNIGTIANRRGRFALQAPRGSAEITAAYMGFATKRFRLVMDSAQTLDIQLTLSPVQLGSATVYAKNAEAIIRQAIAEKQKTLASLHAYQFNAYSKTTLYSDKGRATTGGRNVSINISLGGDSAKSNSALGVQTVLETFSTGYWRKDDGLREVVKQRRQTANIPEENNLNAVFIIYNFNDDEQRMGKYLLAGPTAPNALDLYNYELLDVTSMYGRKVYRLRMTPKSNVTALWDGIVSIADSSWNIVEVSVRPNSVVNFPFIDSLRYTQGFVPVDSVYWMPTNIVIDADLKINILFINAKIRLEHSSVLSDYIINQQIADSIFDQQRVIADTAAVKFDSTYWKTHEVMPLTGDEMAAYVEIDSMVKADTVKPSVASQVLGGIFGAPLLLSQPPFTGFPDLYHFNRVEGHTLGLGLDFPWHAWLPHTTLIGKISYGFSDRRSKWDAMLRQDIPLSKSFTVSPIGSAYRTIRYRPDANFYTTGNITALGLLEKIDYRNYYYAEGWSAGVAFIEKLWSMDGTFIVEDQTAAKKNSDFSLLYPSQKFPENAPIVEGALRAVRLRGRVGVAAPWESVTSAAGIEWESEIADRNSFGGSFTYTRHASTLFTHLRTSSFGFFNARVTGGFSIGGLPPQQLFETEAGAGGFAELGVMRGMNTKEFAGDRFASIAAEENLGSGLFRLTGIPYLEYSGMEFIIDFGAAWSDVTSATQGLALFPINTAKQVYLEAGFGINRILTLFRFDLTWRLTHRYDSGNLALTITAAFF